MSAFSLPFLDPPAPGWTRYRVHARPSHTSWPKLVDDLKRGVRQLRATLASDIEVLSTDEPKIGTLGYTLHATLDDHYHWWTFNISIYDLTQDERDLLRSSQSRILFGQHFQRQGKNE